MTAANSQLVSRSLRIQSIVALLLAGALLLIGPVAAYSSLFGSLAAYIPSLLFALVVVPKFGADSATFLRTAAIAEVAKIFADRSALRGRIYLGEAAFPRVVFCRHGGRHFQRPLWIAFQGRSIVQVTESWIDHQMRPKKSSLRYGWKPSTVAMRMQWLDFIPRMPLTTRWLKHRLKGRQPSGNVCQGICERRNDLPG